MPVLEAESDVELDVRMIDCFRVGARYLPGGVALSRADDASAGAPAPAAACYGRLNINTAPAALLAQLPEMDAALLAGIILSREGEDDLPSAASDLDLFWRARSPFAAARWHNFSGLLLDSDLWGEQTLYERLDRAYGFSRLICFQSLSLSYRNQVPTLADKNRAAPPTRVERIVTVDRGSFETVDYYILAPEHSRRADPDKRYAMPLGAGAVELDLPALLERTETRNLEFLERNPERRETALSLIE